MDKNAAQKKLWSRRLWGKSKKRAKEDGIEFAITPDDIRIPDVCPVMGCVLRFEKGIGDFNPSLDRVDNSRGYVQGNVRAISWRANYLKKNLTLEQAENLVAYMKKEI